MTNYEEALPAVLNLNGHKLGDRVLQVRVAISFCVFLINLVARAELYRISYTGANISVNGFAFDSFSFYFIYFFLF